MAKYYGMKLEKNNKFCELKSKYSKIRFQYGRRKGSINGVDTYFLYPPMPYGKLSLLSEKDFTNVLDPILRKGALRKQKIRTIIIDPGHGGKDSGAIGINCKEKTITLQVAEKLKKLLSDKGFKVIMTRSKDIFIPLKSRPALISKNKGDLFISLHCNSTKNSRVTGIETYTFSPQGTTSTNGGGAINKAMPGNYYNYNNIRLAYDIQKNLKLATKDDDRGIKHSKFAVLKYSSKPAVLVETGFISNPRTAKLLRSSRYQWIVAKAIARGISTYARDVAYGKK